MAQGVYEARKNSGFSTPAHSFQEKWQVDTIWRRDNLIRQGQSTAYARMVDSLNRDEIRVAQGGIFPRFPDMATCWEIDRCANLPVTTGYLDVERFNRRQAERDLGEGPHRLILGLSLGVRVFCPSRSACTQALTAGTLS